MPDGVKAWTGVPPVRRYGIYRNNVRQGLIQALAIRYSITQKIVGEQFFAAMAGEFALRHPPRSPLLLHYGEAFPDYIRAFEPARSVPYLANVARLENARMIAYHAADAPLLDPKALSGLGEEAAAALCLELHPSVSVIQSGFPILTIWSMNEGLIPLGPVDLKQGETVLVYRPHLQILMHKLSSGAAAFLTSLSNGQPLVEACNHALELEADFDVGSNLTALLFGGAVTAMKLDKS